MLAVKLGKSPGPRIFRNRRLGDLYLPDLPGVRPPLGPSVASCADATVNLYLIVREREAAVVPLSAEVLTHNLIVAEGYKLVEDAWAKSGRRTYIHDDEASGAQIKILTRVLGNVGWEMHTDQLRSLRHPRSGDLIELEPGGSDTTGHFLHHMKAFD